MPLKPLLQPYILMALSFIGIADTLYLSLEEYMGKTPACAILNGCDQVLHSVYSKFFGVPLAYIGLVFYIYLLCLAILLAIDSYSRGLKFGLIVYTGIGLALSVFFELFQYFVIHALCLYCAISAGTTLLVFGVAVWHLAAVRRMRNNPLI